jgi:hypothetical protein
MTSSLRCWGVYRELAHSPRRESDDAEILRATARRLAERGYEVELKVTEELPQTNDATGIPPFLFVMCVKEAIVQRLAAWERQGVRIVNRPESIRNTDRSRTIERFAGDGVPFPASVLVSTSDLVGDSPVSFPCWVKRGDFHATQTDDVSFAARPEELAHRLSALASRGIRQAVLQKHVPGDLIKFYGVAPIEGTGESPSWFQWFYHRDQELSHHTFDANELKTAVAGAAATLGLEVFGGDAIATAAGQTFLIDLNAWPSFALYRETAAEKIAARLAERFRPSSLESRLAAESQWPR